MILFEDDIKINTARLRRLSTDRKKRTGVQFRSARVEHVEAAWVVSSEQSPLSRREKKHKEPGP